MKQFDNDRDLLTHFYEVQNEILLRLKRLEQRPCYCHISASSPSTLTPDDSYYHTERNDLISNTRRASMQTYPLVLPRILKNFADTPSWSVPPPLPPISSNVLSSYDLCSLPFDVAPSLIVPPSLPPPLPPPLLQKQFVVSSPPLPFGFSSPSPPPYPPPYPPSFRPPPPLPLRIGPLDNDNSNDSSKYSVVASNVTERRQLRLCSQPKFIQDLYRKFEGDFFGGAIDALLRDIPSSMQTTIALAFCSRAHKLVGLSEKANCLFEVVRNHQDIFRETNHGFASLSSSSASSSSASSSSVSSSAPCRQIDEYFLPLSAICVLLSRHTSYSYFSLLLLYRNAFRIFFSSLSSSASSTFIASSPSESFPDSLLTEVKTHFDIFFHSFLIRFPSPPRVFYVTDCERGKYTMNGNNSNIQNKKEQLFLLGHYKGFFSLDVSAQQLFRAGLKAHKIQSDRFKTEVFASMTSLCPAFQKAIAIEFLNNELQFVLKENLSTNLENLVTKYLLLAADCARDTAPFKDTTDDFWVNETSKMIHDFEVSLDLALEGKLVVIETEFKAMSKNGSNESDKCLKETICLCPKLLKQRARNVPKEWIFACQKYLTSRMEFIVARIKGSRVMTERGQCEDEWREEIAALSIVCPRACSVACGRLDIRHKGAQWADEKEVGWEEVLADFDLTLTLALEGKLSVERRVNMSKVVPEVSWIPVIHKHPLATMSTSDIVHVRTFLNARLQRLEESPKAKWQSVVDMDWLEKLMKIGSWLNPSAPPLKMSANFTSWKVASEAGRDVREWMQEMWINEATTTWEEIITNFQSVIEAVKRENWEIEHPSVIQSKNAAFKARYKLMHRTRKKMLGIPKLSGYDRDLIKYLIEDCKYSNDISNVEPVKPNYQKLNVVSFESKNDGSGDKILLPQDSVKRSSVTFCFEVGPCVESSDGTRQEMKLDIPSVPSSKRNRPTVAAEVTPSAPSTSTAAEINSFREPRPEVTQLPLNSIVAHNLCVIHELADLRMENRRLKHQITQRQ